MDILNKTLQMYRGFSNEPMIPDDQQDDLEASNNNVQETIFDDYDKSNLPSSNTLQEPIVMPNEDVVIDFATEGNQTTPSPERENAPLRTQAQQNNAVQRDVNYQREVENVIKMTLNGVLKWNTVSGSIFTLLILTMKWNLSFMYILLLICLVDIYTLLNLLYNKPQLNSSENRRYVANVIETTLSTAAKMSLMVYDYIEPFHLIYSFAPTLLFDFLYAFSLVIKYRKSSLRKFYFAQLLLKIATVTFVTSVILKIDHILNWQWKDIFSIFWILFSILVGITVISGFAFIFSFRNFFAERRFHQLYGLAWLILIFGGAFTFSGLLADNLEYAFEHRHSANSLAFIFIMTAGYNIGMAIYTTFYFRKIQTFFRRLASIEVQEEDTSASKTQGEKLEDSPNQKVSIPFFLTRSSNTFFKRATQEDINETNKSKTSKSKSTTPKSKSSAQSKHYRRASLDTSKSRQLGFASQGLGSIPETEREQGRDDAASSQRSSRWTKRRSPNFNDSIPSIKQFGSFASLVGDRSKCAVISSSRRNLCDGSDNEYAIMEACCSPPRGRQNEDMENPLYQIRQNQPMSLNIKDMKTRSVSNDFDLEFESDRPSITKRRGQSLKLLPGAHIPGLSEIVESASFKENSRTEGETGASPTNEISGAQQCLICFDKQPDAVFLECGHGGVCYECSLEIWKTTNECYLCRKNITQVVQVDYKLKIGKNVLQVVSVTQMVLNNSSGKIANF